MTYDLFRHARSLPWLCFGLLVFSSVLIADVPVGQDRGGQSRSGGTPQNPSTVEFLVLGADGQPVTDLKAEEVSLRIAGRERKVESLELKRFAAGAPGAATAAAPPPFATNAGGAAAAAAPGRVFMFVIEDQSVRPGDERPIRASIEKLLETLGPNDRVGLLTTPNATVRLVPTTDRARVKQELGRISGQRPGSMNSTDRACRTRDSLVALRSILPVLESNSGGLATVVFFSSQLEQAATTSTGDAGCMVTTDLFNGIASTSAASRAHIFVVQAEESVSQRSEGLENLASVSGGGQVLPLVSSGDPLERIARETAAYYVATFRPEQNDRVGGGQRLELRVSRPGVHARSYGEYTFRAGAAAASGAPGNVRDMLKTPGTFTDVPIRVAAFPARAAGEKLRVLVLVEPGTPETKFASGAVGLIDAKNSMRQLVFDDKTLALPTAIVPFEVDPGSYRVRVAVTDASGKAGTVEYNLDANLVSAGTIKLSAMLLGALRGTGFTPVMQFKDEDQAVVYVEAYGDRGQGAVSAKVELVGADGKVMQEIQPGGSATNEPDKVILTAAVPLKELKPGDYVVRLRFQLEGQPEGVVSHTLRKIQ